MTEMTPDEKFALDQAEEYHAERVRQRRELAVWRWACLLLAAAALFFALSCGGERRAIPAEPRRDCLSEIGGGEVTLPRVICPEDLGRPAQQENHHDQN